ncbi:hypothetical protein AK812_SmicGene46260 [Symbiodinium microadriaticum]|uniref:Uncharacterized protein n=1 Tax=Symbiodinium microadriaticum TaxID=2951 RepID=A0A1Q9BU95_SYMMI|nr:hypothetical protein AK812_SmicGene46260 [Symbiodinium microadriaticum]
MLFTSLSQLESSLKKCTADVSKHVKALASSRKREAKKLKDKEAKNAAAKQLSTVQERITKAKADGADMPGMFKMQVDDMAKVKTCTNDALTSDMDLTQLLVLEYKKVSNIEELGKVNQPFQTKAGKEPTELFFNELLKPVETYLFPILRFVIALKTAGITVPSSFSELEKDGKNVDKMNEVLGCLKSATAELKAK